MYCRLAMGNASGLGPVAEAVAAVLTAFKASQAELWPQLESRLPQSILGLLRK